jgi:hypothetical protein
MLLGCAHAAEQVAAKTASTTVQQTSSELSEPKNQRAMVAFWSDPGMQTAVRKLAANTTDGSLDALSEPQRVQRLAELSGQYIERVTAALASGVNEQLAPQLVAMAADAADAGVQRALSERNRAAARDLVAEMTQASAQAMATAIRDDIGPAIRQTLAQDMGPGLVAMLDPDFNRAVAATTEQVALSSMVGTRRGLAADVPEARPGTLLSYAHGLGGQAILFIKLLLLAAVLGAIGLGLLIVLVRSQTRREEAKIRRREAGALFLIQALRSEQDKPHTSEIRDLVRETLEDLTADPGNPN